MAFTGSRPNRESFLERHHFLTFLVFAGMGLGLTTVGVKHPERMAGIQQIGLRITGPLAHLGGVVSGAGDDAVTGIRLTWTAHRDLATAQEELDELKLQMADRTEVLAENERLRGLLDLSERVPLATVPARVVYQEHGPDAILVIDRGTEHGVREDQPVITPEGVVGKVLTVTGKLARVQCLIDGDAGIAILVGEERRQANAVVVSGSPGRCRLRHLDLLQDLHVGDAVVTSGLDLIYPRGLLVGTVERVDEVPGVQQDVVVRPAVDFTRIEEVLVVVSGPKPGDRLTGSGEAPRERSGS